MTPRSRDGLQGARNSQEDVEGTQGPRNKGTPGPAPGSGVEQPKFPVTTPAPQGPLEVLQQQFGKEESGRSISTERRTSAVPVDPHAWVHENRPRGSSSSALAAKSTTPTLHRGIPTAFPEFLQSSAKLPQHQNYRRKDLSLVSICPRNPRESKIDGKALPSRKAPNSGREEKPSLPINIKYKNTVSMGISHCWER